MDAIYFYKYRHIKKNTNVSSLMQYKTEQNKDERNIKNRA